MGPSCATSNVSGMRQVTGRTPAREADPCLGECANGTLCGLLAWSCCLLSSMFRTNAPADDGARQFQEHLQQLRDSGFDFERYAAEAEATPHHHVATAH